MEGLPALPTAPGAGPSYASGAAGASLTAPSRALPDDPPFKVFIGNIPYDATAQQMGEVFYPELQVSAIIPHHVSRIEAEGSRLDLNSRQDQRPAPMACSRL